jgi:hypothetical protein
MIACAALLTRSLSVGMPRSLSIVISSSSVLGLTTTPGPITGVMCGCSTPLGTR